MEQCGVSPEVAIAARLINERQSEIAGFLESHARKRRGFPSNPKIALCGIAFKGRLPTDDERGSMAFPLWREPKAAFPGGRFVAHNPVIENPTLVALGMTPVETLEDAFRDINLTVLANNHPNLCCDLTGGIRGNDGYACADLRPLK
jgi:UDP-N-acetyl-D-mannosaminuronate dehydrogenase